MQNPPLANNDTTSKAAAILQTMLAVKPCLAYKTPRIPAPKQNFKNPLGKYFCINMRSLYAKILTF